jgi:thiamine pyrophosphate-dependent acetolactate synthase large subunit-like protein
MEITGAELIITLLERQGIETIAGIPGGANLPIYDALGRFFPDIPVGHVLSSAAAAGERIHPNGWARPSEISKHETATTTI